MAIFSQLVARIENRLARQFAGPHLQIKAKKPLISFTFDDVPDTALSQGAKILERHNARGTFYISGGLTGRVEEDRKLISAQGCSELADMGHEVGSHTFDHLHMRLTSKATLSEDLDKNHQFFSDLDENIQLQNFAYPYNQASLSGLSLLKKRYRSARAGRIGINRGSVPSYHLHGVEIAQPENPTRLLEWIDDVSKNSGWLIFFTHDVSEQPTQYGSTPQLLDRLVAHAKASKCDVVTVNNALDCLGAP